MILIVEAGGTKTHWAFVKEDVVEIHDTSGFNAMQNTSLSNLIRQEFPMDAVSKVYFYAAGVTDERVTERVQSALHELLPHAEIEVASDVLGACRGVYGSNSGWLGLLGTGSGLVYFDGLSYTASQPSLGYLIGDEGSGMDIGRGLLRAYLRKQLPAPIAKSFRRYGQPQDILKQLYQSKEPASFMGSFVQLLNEHTEDPFVSDLVRQAFERYFETYLPQNQHEVTEVVFIGSVAFHFRAALLAAALDYKTIVKEVFQSPLQGLIDHHRL